MSQNTKKGIAALLGPFVGLWLLLAPALLMGGSSGASYQLSDAELAQIAGLADPNADRILFWDDSAGSYAHLTVGSGLTLTDTTLTSSGGIGGSTGSTDNSILRADGTGGATAQAGSAITITDAGVIQLLGTTSSFPGIRRHPTDTTTTSFITADASADAPIMASRWTNTAIASASVGAWSGRFYLASGSHVAWKSTAAIAAENDTNGDLFLSRAAAGTLRITSNGSSAPGGLLSAVLVEANTAGSGAPNVLVAAESGTVLTNEGVTAKNYHTLPTAAAGLRFRFCAQDADGIRIVANTDDTIRVIDKVTAAAGYIESTTIGSCVEAVSINAVEWFATDITGVWTDGTFTYDDTSLTTP